MIQKQTMNDFNMQIVQVGQQKTMPREGKKT